VFITNFKQIIYFYKIIIFEKMKGNDDIIIPTKQISYKAIWNQEIDDFNPVCIYENGELNCQPLDVHYFPLSFLMKFKEDILNIINYIGCIIVEYDTNTEIGPRLEVTAFPVHPNYIFTVKHLYEPLIDTKIIGKHFTFGTLPRMHPYMIKEYKKRIKLNEKNTVQDGLFCKIKKIDEDSELYEEKYKKLISDLKYTELNRSCDFSFSFVKNNGKDKYFFDKDMCLIPSTETIQNGDIVAIIAYHGSIIDEWIEESYEGCENKPTMDQLRKMFDNFDHKCVSPGVVMEAGKYYFTVDCSILPGSSGAPVFKLDFSNKKIHWIGFVLSGAKGNGYNACMSVLHPGFSEYYKFIYHQWRIIGVTNKKLEKYVKFCEY